MNPALLLILIVTGNLVLYWLFWGKKRFEKKLAKEVEDGRETPHS
ncbi:MAG TPA: hypothetical protein VJG49_01955 [Candidatus Nanoarchaeia archaeon]|nr:hypothetical protein [Candidatus Nanoarchaeia archaeon]